MRYVVINRKLAEVMKLSGGLLYSAADPHPRRKTLFKSYEAARGAVRRTLRARCPCGKRRGLCGIPKPEWADPTAFQIVPVA